MYSVHQRRQYIYYQWTDRYSLCLENMGVAKGEGPVGPGTPPQSNPTKNY